MKGHTRRNQLSLFSKLTFSLPKKQIWRWTLTSLSTKLFVYETALTPLVLYLVFLVISKLILFFLPWYLGFLSTIFHECVVIVFFVYFFWVVSPFRAEGGLFWVPTFGDDLESQRDWIEATQHAYSEVFFSFPNIYLFFFPFSIPYFLGGFSQTPKKGPYLV